METISMKVVFIMLMFIAVQAQQFFPSDYYSYLLSESEFPQDSEDTNLPLQISQQLSQETHYSPNSDKTSDLSSDSQHFPLETDESYSEIHFPSHHSQPPSSSPKPALTPENTCKTKCDTKCMSKKVPILHNLCIKVCRKRCMLLYMREIYICTNKCAESMPENFKSDKKKVSGYVNYCYRKCVKKL